MAPADQAAAAGDQGTAAGALCTSKKLGLSTLTTVNRNLLSTGCEALHW